MCWKVMKREYASWKRRLSHWRQKDLRWKWTEIITIKRYYNIQIKSLRGLPFYVMWIRTTPSCNCFHLVTMMRRIKMSQDDSKTRWSMLIFFFFFLRLLMPCLFLETHCRGRITKLACKYRNSYKSSGETAG